MANVIQRFAWSAPPSLLDRPVDASIPLDYSEPCQICDTGWAASPSLRPLGDDGFPVLAPVAGSFPVASWLGVEPRHRTDRQAQVLLRASFDLRAQTQADNTSGDLVIAKYLLVNLQGTRVNAEVGTESYQPNGSFSYVDMVDVHLDFLDEVPGLERDQDSPDTSTLTGTTSSSISKSVGIGVFGSDGTGNLSATWSNSFSVALQDFKLQNRSNGNSVLQSLRMAMSTGATYSRPTDLISSSLGLNFSEDAWPGVWFNVYSLSPPPDKAMSDIPIPTQALFVVPGATVAKSRLRIRIKMNVVVFQSYELDVTKYGGRPGRLSAASMGPGHFPLKGYCVYEYPTVQDWITEVDFGAVGLPSS